MSASALAENLRLFSSADHFRSASVDELMLEDDFFRRPLRPEDLDFLKFERPVTEQTFGALSSLMSQRVLLSINEAEEACPPPAKAQSITAWRSFQAAEVRCRGRELADELEAHALGFLDGEASADPAEAVASGWEGASAFWEDQKSRLRRSGYEEEGLRFILIQHVPLGECLFASARNLPSEFGGTLASGTYAETAAALREHLERLGLRTGRHSYWQFYLAGSIAAVNLLYRLARSPSTLGDYVGARLILEADRRALRQIFCPSEALPETARASLMADAAPLLALVNKQLGPLGTAAAGAGAARMSRLLAAARAGLAAQLTWLSDLEWAQRAARQVMERIERECPDIDRDIFVEPREMCSTTHVHDEHRLVVIETGRMRFWGNVGMRHDMGPGDMILVPKGRLHGSTVLSESCTYQQPIIPDDWQEAAPPPDEAI